MSFWKSFLLVSGYLLMAVPLTISKDTRRPTPWVDFAALGGVVVFVCGVVVKKGNAE